MDDIKDFIKMFSIREIIEKIVLFLVFFFIFDIFNIPTFIIEKYKIAGLILIGLLFLFIIINKKIVRLLKVNVFNYIDLFLVASLMATIIYILFARYIEYSKFKLLLSVILEMILIVISIIRIFILYKAKNKETKEDNINVYDIKMLYENKIDNSNNNLIFLEEKDVSYDLLNRNKIIDDLFGSINFCRNKNKFIISLTGKWGSGKTTILNIVKERLNKERFIVIDNFEIWKYNNEKSLIYGIVDEILKKLNINFSALETKKIVNSCVSMLSAKTDINLDFISSDNKMLEKIKMTISDYLNKNDKRVIFIIDNLERTNENNILIILKAIATILNMDRFIYVLSYDEDEMKSIFQEKLKINYDYMEKIIQLPLSVPIINQDDINQICTQCLENLLKHYGIEEKEIKQYIPAFQLFNKNIKDLRSFKRKVNSMCNSCFFGSNYLNKIDSFLIELINQENTKLYEEIQTNYQFYVSEDQVAVYGYSGYDAKSFNENATKYFDKLFEDKENAKYKDILGLLFPNVSKYTKAYRYNGNNVEFWNESGYIIPRDKEEYHQSVIQRRIYNAKFFGLYFTKQQNEFINIDDKINDFIKWNNEKEYDIGDKEFVVNLGKRLKEVLYLYIGVGQKYILETFEIHVNEIEKNKLAILMYLISSQEYMDDTMIFLGLNARRRSEIICAEIIKKLSEEEMITLKEIIETDYRNMNFYRGILYWLKPENNYSLNNKNEDVFNKINESYKKLIENVFENDINIYSTYNYSRYNIYCLIDDDRYKNQVQFINESTVFKFLADMITNSVGNSYGYSINLEQFNKLTSYEFIDNILNKIDKSKMTETEKLIEEVYQKSKVKESNKMLDENIVYRDEFVDIGRVNIEEREREANEKNV